MLLCIMCLRSCWLVTTPLTLRVQIFSEERYLVSVCAAICEGGGQGRRALMLIVHAFRFRGVISRFWWGGFEGLWVWWWQGEVVCHQC